jgi:glycosyltransferase involved in cell wall biosynthesis
MARAAMDRLLHCLIAVSRRNGSLRRDRLRVRCRHFVAILNGVPITEQSPEEIASNRHGVRRQLGIAPDAVVVGSVVRLAAGKGLHDLLHAFAKIEEPRAQLLLVGEGPLRPELEACATGLGVAGRVLFAGHQRAPGRYLDAMDMFVLAVPAGSMSIALLEAMARGLPSVITFCGPEEAVIDGRTGLCAPPEDPDGLAAVLGRLARNPGLRRQLGRDGAAHVRSQFSSERVVDDLLIAYGVRSVASIPGRLSVTPEQPE